MIVLTNSFYKKIGGCGQCEWYKTRLKFNYYEGREASINSIYGDAFKGFEEKNVFSKSHFASSQDCFGLFEIVP